jgi:hypothetical protein
MLMRDSNSVFCRSRADPSVYVQATCVAIGLRSLL